MMTGSDERIGVGVRGEEIAARYLERRGYRIVERRYRCRAGEIDLVAQEAGEMVFVEVKTRRGDTCGSPLEAVTRRKQNRLILLARIYLAHRRLCDVPCRFDVVGIRVDANGTDVQLVQNAFGVGD